MSAGSRTRSEPSAPAHVSMTPRALPKANAATFASVGRAPTNSQKPTHARIPASSGAFVAVLPFASGVDGMSTSSRSSRSSPFSFSTAIAPCAPGPIPMMGGHR
jgi:hypothetical protein